MVQAPFSGECATILWNFPIQTDIVIKDYNRGTCLSIDMSVPQDQDVSRKESEKLSLYKDLQIEITRIWNLSTIIIPVIIGV